MCDARAVKGEANGWAPVSDQPDLENLLRDTLDNLVELPERDLAFVREQLVAFANCIRQRMSKEVLFHLAESLTNAALAGEQWTLKRMLREMRQQEDANRSKTSGASTTSDGSPRNPDAF